jgi:transposase-like protein
LRKPQKNYTPEQKVGLLRRHLLERASVSELCREADIQPTVFYRWLEKLFKQGTQVFARGEGESVRRVDQEKIEKLEKKLRQRDEVMAELMAEHVQLKKAVGGL